MQSGAFRWVTGLEEPINFQSLDWVERASALQKPVLLLHGKGDLSTPFEVSEVVADLRPDLIQLVRFDVEGHSQEWNVDIEKWEGAVADWIIGLNGEVKEGDEAGELADASAE
jgi:pimeloyl-ACP methyl ester carboxylesterase